MTTDYPLTGLTMTTPAYPIPTTLIDQHARRDSWPKGMLAKTSKLEDGPLDRAWRIFGLNKLPSSTPYPSPSILSIESKNNTITITTSSKAGRVNIIHQIAILKGNN